MEKIRKSLLELKHVSFGDRIIDDVSLSVDPDEILVITGANGSGKSTLAQVIMGIKKQTNGKIILNGKNISSLSLTERAKSGIALSFQLPVRLKGITVSDLLRISVAGAKPKDAVGDKQLELFLRTVGLEPSEYLSREVDSSLSGGEMKRIEIASILARNARLNIFDEPEAGIDLWSLDNLIRTFKKMRKTMEDSAIIIISHQEKIMQIANRIIVLDSGKIQKSGDATEVLNWLKNNRRVERRSVDIVREENSK